MKKSSVELKKGQVVLCEDNWRKGVFTTDNLPVLAPHIGRKFVVISSSVRGTALALQMMNDNETINPRAATWLLHVERVPEVTLVEGVSYER